MVYNLTIKQIPTEMDGFGSQYLKILTGFTYCEISPHNRYIHTPFEGFDPNHMPEEWVGLMNDFIGIPDMRRGQKIHRRRRVMEKPLKQPDCFFNSDAQDKILNWYYKNKKPESCTDICIHIRRGDLHMKHKRIRDPYVWEHKRMSSNGYYNEKIPNILKQFPNEKITIHTEGKWAEFEPIMDGWSSSMVDAIDWKLNDDPRNVFHDFLTCPVLFLARSSLSYCAALLKRSDQDVYFQSGPTHPQTTTPKIQWKNWEDLD